MKHTETSVSKRFTSWIEEVGATEAVEALVSAARGAVFAVDENREIIFWSDPENLLGYKPTDVLGQHCLKVNRCETCIRGCGIAEHGRVHNVPLTLFGEQGAAVDVRKSGRAFFDAEGKFIGGIEVLHPEHAPKLAHPPRPKTEADAFHGILTRDPDMKSALQVVRNVAETDTTVLVRGESGTGKELVARALHQESHRRDKPFEAINCAALSPTLLESELFGHEKGAFTGAIRNRPGLFRRADGGTVFLDEVAELPLATQAKLLRVLEERELTPVGGDRTHTVDVRVIAATHRSLRKETSEGRFREDLLYRLRVVPVFLPALRERREDIELLLHHFVELNNERGPRRVTDISPEAARLLLEHPWPGNIRELRNVVDYAFAVGRGAVIVPSELPPEFREPRPTTTSQQDKERARIAAAIEAARGNLGDAASALGMSRATLWRKRKKFGL